MLKNYILVALRRLQRERTYVLINIFSLALGIASFLLLALYLRSELTYDKHNADYQRIYRLVARFGGQSGEKNFAVTQMGLGPLMLKDYPQLGQQVRFNRAQQSTFKYKDVQRAWDDIYLADPSVFDIFSHKILYGDPKTAFNSPYSLAISESFAKYYFGDENPIGKTLAGTTFNFAVTLVFADLPENSHLKYSALFPMSLMEVFNPNFTKSYENTLGNVALFTYVKVPPEFKRGEIDAISKGFVDSHMKDMLTRFKDTFRADLQPLADVHFGEKLNGDLPTGNIFYVYGFAAVAIFILLVACINYMNLATARAIKRAKEVGMRKVLGASKSQLVAQFLGESLTFTVIALVIGLALVWVALMLTPIGSLMGTEHLLNARSEPAVLLGIVLLSFLVALISGLYPAFYLSAISPLAALTHVKKSWKTGFSMRQILVLAQLCISIGVIACTLLMTNQMRYVHDKPLGFAKENRLIVTLRGYDVVKNVKTIKKALRDQPNILSVSTIGMVPGTGSMINVMPVENNVGVMEPMGMDRVPVGLNFIDAMGVKVIEGRGFSEDIATDTREAVMVNESFVKKAGWDKPLGKRFQVGGPNNIARVIGVVEDFHYASLHNEIGPMMMHPVAEQFDNVPELQKPLLATSIVVAMSGQDIGATLEAVKGVIAKFDPKFNFEPVFLEDRLNELYKSESNLMKLTGIFAAICIFISVMGLFGLTAFTAEQRTKEFGIRMVLGASDLQIASMLSRHFLLLVVVAAIPASIAGYKIIGIWMERFVYHTGISWATFMLATLLVALVTLVTVALQSLKLMQADPIKALRYE